MPVFWVSLEGRVKPMPSAIEDDDWLWDIIAYYTIIYYYGITISNAASLALLTEAIEFKLHNLILSWFIGIYNAALIYNYGERRIFDY